MLCASRRLVHSSDPEPLRRTRGGPARAKALTPIAPDLDRSDHWPRSIVPRSCAGCRPSSVRTESKIAWLARDPTGRRSIHATRHAGRADQPPTRVATPPARWAYWPETPDRYLVRTPAAVKPAMSATLIVQVRRSESGASPCWPASAARLLRLRPVVRADHDSDPAEVGRVLQHDLRGGGERDRQEHPDRSPHPAPEDQREHDDQ